MIGRQLFPGKYANVPEYIIAEKASKGQGYTRRDRDVFKWVYKFDVSDEGDGVCYVKFGCTESEYIVSDDELRFAN